jgi:EAL domain-containing protein (putative c-di-GMP-specific phosphodiesterase class I)
VQQWRASIDPKFRISINKSPVQFLRTDRTHGDWGATLQSMGLPGEAIVVEITEGLLLEKDDGVAEQLLSLGDAGIQVSLDDFGTGYSSLSYLQRFDIDFIKIDQSFVRHLVKDSTDLALCKAIIAMAHALGIQVVAEGVETASHYELLLSAGCDYAQGYFISRPVAAEEFEVFVRQHHARAAEIAPPGGFHDAGI